jgi:hypothetical protein
MDQAGRTLGDIFIEGTPVRVRGAGSAITDEIEENREPSPPPSRRTSWTPIVLRGKPHLQEPDVRIAEWIVG